MGFLDDVFEALLDPLNHPAEAAMMMSMMEEEEEKQNEWRLYAEDGSDYGLDPEDFELVTGIRWNDASDNLKAHSYYAFYYDKTVDPSSSDMTDILISDETKQLIGTGSVVVEYDAVTGKVYSVWYSETKNCSVINDGRLNRAVRLRMDEQPEGYYTGEVYE